MLPHVMMQVKGASNVELIVHSKVVSRFIKVVVWRNLVTLPTPDCYIITVT